MISWIAIRIGNRFGNPARASAGSNLPNHSYAPGCGGLAFRFPARMVVQTPAAAERRQGRCPWPFSAAAGVCNRLTGGFASPVSLLPGNISGLRMHEAFGRARRVACHGIIPAVFRPDDPRRNMDKRAGMGAYFAGKVFRRGAADIDHYKNRWCMARAVHVCTAPFALSR